MVLVLHSTVAVFLDGTSIRLQHLLMDQQCRLLVQDVHHGSVTLSQEISSAYQHEFIVSSWHNKESLVKVQGHWPSVLNLGLSGKNPAKSYLYLVLNTLNLMLAEMPQRQGLYRQCNHFVVCGIHPGPGACDQL